MDATTRSIRFPGDLWDDLTKEATDRLVSVNWLVTQLCREGLERLTPEIKVTT